MRETLFENLDNFSIAYQEDFMVFDIEAICVQSVEVNDTTTTLWIDTHVDVSLSISSKLLDEPVFFYAERILIIPSYPLLFNWKH